MNDAVDRLRAPCRAIAGQVALATAALCAVLAAFEASEIKRLLDRPRRLVIITSCKGYLATNNVTKHGRHTLECLRLAASDLMRQKMGVTVEHSEPVIGKVAAAWVDRNGLLVRLLFTRSRCGRDAGRMVKSGVLTGLSPKFKSLDYYVNQDTGIKVFRRIRVFGVSLTSDPVDPCARIIAVGEDAG